MWIHERLKPKNWKGQPVAVKQRKYNGHRFTMFKQSISNGSGLVGFGRDMRPEREITLIRPDIVNYPWWKSLVANMPQMSSIDGELYIPEGNAGDATTAIAKCSKNLEFMAFALPWYNGQSLAEKTVSEARTICLNGLGVDFAKPLPMYPDDTFEKLCSDATDLGYEGWVLKLANYKGWWKAKPQKEVDCIVTGFVEGNGKYLGLVGSLKVSVWMRKSWTPLNDDIDRRSLTEQAWNYDLSDDHELIEIANVSGMDDETRVDIDEKKDLGRVCEVEYQEVGNGGRLIHAHFVRWRDDKPADECVVNRSDL